MDFLSKTTLKEFLDNKATQYNSIDFIKTDPISIPHLFDNKLDIEAIGFIMATISWGQRITIINNGKKLAELMGNSPHDYILNYNAQQSKKLLAKGFVHRTFNVHDLDFFMQALHKLYQTNQSLEQVFLAGIKPNDTDLKNAIIHFGKAFFDGTIASRTNKHVARPQDNSAAKRINMYLRWMVRKDATGVDFGLWHKISPAMLSIPLDVHSGNVARKLGLLSRTINDWKAVEELDAALRNFDKNDPIKYDFALFGLGAFERF